MRSFKMPKNRLVTKEYQESILQIWKMIFPYLPYRNKVLLRNLSKAFINFFDQAANVPFLSTQNIQSALAQIQIPQQVGLNDLSESFVVGISPIPDSLDSILISFDPIMRPLDNHFNVLDVEGDILKKPLHINSVLLFANNRYNTLYCIKGIGIQYTSIASPEQRRERENFISKYLSLPDIPEMPRWKYLESQTLESLNRLLQSLNRYRDEKHRALIPEVNQAIEAKLADELKNKLVI